MAYSTADFAAKKQHEEVEPWAAFYDARRLPMRRAPISAEEAQEQGTRSGSAGLWQTARFVDDISFLLAAGLPAAPPSKLSRAYSGPIANARES